MGCKSAVIRNICSSCKLFGILSSDFFNDKLSVGDDRLFTVTVSEQQHMSVEFARELMCLRDGHLSCSNAFVLSYHDIQLILDSVTVAHV